MYTSLSHRDPELTSDDISVELTESQVHLHIGSSVSTYLALSVNEAELIAKALVEVLPAEVWLKAK